MHKKNAVKKANTFMLKQTFLRLFTVFAIIIILIVLIFSIFAKSAQDIYVSDNRSHKVKITYNISNSLQKIIKGTIDTISTIYAYGADTIFDSISDGDKAHQDVIAGIEKESYIGSILLVTEKGGSLNGISTDTNLGISDYMNNLPYSYDELMNIFDKSEYPYDLFKINKPSSSSAYRYMDDFCYIRRIISTKNGATLGLIIINYKKNELRNYMSLAALSSKETFCIINYRDEIVMQIGDYYLPDELSYKKIIPGYNNISTLSSTNEKIEVYGGNETGIPYKTMVCSKYDNNVWNTYNNRVLIIVIMSCICAVMIVYIVSVALFQNKAIQNVWNLLQHKDKSQINKMLVEDSGSLEGMVSKEIVYANRLEKQNDNHLYIMKCKMLIELFTSHTPINIEQETANFERVGINMANRCFSVAVFEGDNIKASDRSTDVTDRETELLRFVIENILKEYAECYAILINNNIVCLLSSNQNLTDSNIKEYINTVIKVCKDELSHDLRCGIGNISYGISDISESYYRAFCALEYAHNNSNIVCNYNEMETYGNKQSDYARSIEDKYHLINLIKAREYDNARTVLSKILINMMRDVNVSGEFMRLQIYEMLRAIINNICAGVPENDSNKRVLDEKAGHIFYCRNIDEFSKIALDIFDSAVALATDNSDNRDDFLTMVTEIVENGYGNPDMSVSFIAEKTKINSRTLSAKFIKKTGKGLLDYIHSVRIEHAKKLLIEKNNTVQDVSELVGYENSNTFIRVFKRYCDMTPGHYQEMYKK